MEKDIVLNLSMQHDVACLLVIWLVKINIYYLQTCSTLKISNNIKHFHTVSLWTKFSENRELSRRVVFPNVMLTDPYGFQFYF